MTHSRSKICGLRLDRRRRGVAFGLQRLEERRIEAELGKRRQWFSFHVCRADQRAGRFYAAKRFLLRAFVRGGLASLRPVDVTRGEQQGPRAACPML
jgi:hypothetical protein